jgi:hypothetical protein
MNIGLGIITKELDENNTIEEFLENAKKYGHHIKEVIVGYAESIQQSELEKLSKLIDVKLVNVIHDEEMARQLHLLGIGDELTDYVIHNPQDRNRTLLPYGMLRNNVILKAILDGLDYLVFIDTDVYPEVLNKDFSTDEVDFFGMHLEAMKEEGVMVTTSDYSGYYIVPKINFDQLEDYLIGVGKERAIDFVMGTQYQARCFDPGINRKPFETDKILGGNLMIDLAVFKQVVPFFSSIFRYDGQSYLTRGEDTVLGLAIKKCDGIMAMDIDLKIRHDTYGNFPQVPNIYEEQHVKDRFYYASIGWIGRNPFMYWVTGGNVNQHYQEQLIAMRKTEKAISYHLDDWRFEGMSQVIKLSYCRLNCMINQYNHFIENWGKIVNILIRRGVY